MPGLSILFGALVGLALGPDRRGRVDPGRAVAGLWSGRADVRSGGRVAGGGWVLPADRPLILVVDAPADAAEAARHLVRIGIDRLAGYLKGGITAWETAGYELAGVEPVSVHDLHERLDGGDAPAVLDVRTDAEWNAGHIEGAVHIHGGQLKDRLGEVPQDRPLVVICGSGYRASITASHVATAYRPPLPGLGREAAGAAARRGCAAEHDPCRQRDGTRSCAARRRRVAAVVGC